MSPEDTESLQSQQVRSGESVLRRQPQQQRSQQRIEQILKAAAEVFWEAGYEAATTHDIAQRAQTAVGTLYRFFPHKLAIFHALEQRHKQHLEVVNAALLTAELMQSSLVAGVRRMVETYAEYFEDLGHRVVYIQYFLTPDIFDYFDETTNYAMTQHFASMLRSLNPSLSVQKSELVAQVCHQSYNALLLTALRSDADRREQLYAEMEHLLVAYLEPHVGDRPAPRPQAIEQQAEALSRQHRLNSRQQLAIAHLLQHGTLAIQDFEALCPAVSRRTLQRDIKQLASENLVYSEGDTNQLVYRMKPLHE